MSTRWNIKCFTRKVIHGLEELLRSPLTWDREEWEWGGHRAQDALRPRPRYPWTRHSHHTLRKVCCRSDGFEFCPSSVFTLKELQWSPNGVGGEGWELFLVVYSFSHSKYTDSTRSTTNERETLRVTLPLALQRHTLTVRPFPSCPVSLPRKSFQMAGSTPATISPPREQLLFIYLALLAELPLPVVLGPLERWWHSRNILCAAASRDSHFLVLQ